MKQKHQIVKQKQKNHLFLSASFSYRFKQIFTMPFFFKKINMILQTYTDIYLQKQNRKKIVLNLFNLILRYNENQNVN